VIASHELGGERAGERHLSLSPRLKRAQAMGIEPHEPFFVAQEEPSIPELRAMI
jgi:hypothetical protein